MCIYKLRMSPKIYTGFLFPASQNFSVLSKVLTMCICLFDNEKNTKLLTHPSSNDPQKWLLISPAQGHLCYATFMKMEQKFLKQCLSKLNIDSVQLEQNLQIWQLVITLRRGLE